LCFYLFDIFKVQRVIKYYCFSLFFTAERDISEMRHWIWKYDRTNSNIF